MATIKLRSTKSANRLINYAAKKATIANGWNVMPEHAKEEFALTRKRFGKEDGRQAIHLIQSFKPGEVSPELANEIGTRLARYVAPGHEVAIYTHTDREHIHNHLVINTVSFENGKKWQSGPENIDRIRRMSDEMCREYGLSVIEKPLAKERLTMAELQIATSGRTSWKDELRTWISDAKEKTKSLEDMREYLKQNYGVEMKIQNKNLSFLHPSAQKFVRGKTLGNDYTREGLRYGHGIGEAKAIIGEERTGGLDREDRGIVGTTVKSDRENDRGKQNLGTSHEITDPNVSGRNQADTRGAESTRDEDFADRSDHDPKRDDADRSYGEPGTEKEHETQGPDHDGADRGSDRSSDWLGNLSSASSLIGKIDSALDKIKSLGGDDKESPQQQKINKKKKQQHQHGLHR